MSLSTWTSRYCWWDKESQNGLGWKDPRWVTNLTAKHMAQDCIQMVLEAPSEQLHTLWQHKAITAFVFMQIKT